MNVADLREILQYVPKFRGKTFVVAIDGEVVESENFANILLDLAVLRSLNIKVAIVHGASRQIERNAFERGITISNSDGTGIVDAATLQVSIDASIRLTNEIMEGLSAVDLRAAYANAIIAHPAGIIHGVDYEFSGRVERVDTKALNLLLEEGIVPVIPPMGFDGEGRTFRVNSDWVAVEVAEALRAYKVIFLAPPTISQTAQNLPPQLSIAEIEDFLKKPAAATPTGTLSKLECAAKACRQGVPRVHLLDGSINEALLTEIFSNEGIGTMIYSNEYQQIRRIFKKDVRGMLTLIRQSVKSEELIRRTRADILEHIEDYWILEIDKNPIACVALHAYPEDKSGELACLYVSKNHENQGFGRKLMKFVESLAKEKGMDRLFALSTQASHFLQQKGGFKDARPEVLPASRRERYETSGRNSKILLKSLV